MATPYYCLRQLGVITTEKRGGREFELFRAAVQRIAGMRYQNDAFYDPIRGEHRAVSFGFLNYSLPLDPGSSRAWRFAWDPIFFELAQATGGTLSFDLAVYRSLDAASRRLYLYLKKIFWRRDTTGALDLRQLAVDVLGFAPTVETSHLKRKVARCIQQLLDLNLLRLPTDAASVMELFTKKSKGVYTFRLYRGEAFAFPTSPLLQSEVESPLVEPLRSIGFDTGTIHRIIGQHPASLIEQWADITLAAKERHGADFFRRSPQAYFLDNVKGASEKRRTPPDWWRDLRKCELRREREQEQSKAKLFDEKESGDEFEKYLQAEARDAFQRITQKLIADLRKAGQGEPEARDNADYMARVHLRQQFDREHPEADGSTGFRKVGSLM